jgi:hypothetical protein
VGAIVKTEQFPKSCSSGEYDVNQDLVRSTSVGPKVCKKSACFSTFTSIRGFVQEFCTNAASFAKFVGNKMSQHGGACK